uniref:Uncharacterized protein n=1 Tax=Knipowitschia caucasica TaxID=637954 RepID=A0AAV2MFY8_KNICA
MSRAHDNLSLDVRALSSAARLCVFARSDASVQCRSSDAYRVRAPVLRFFPVPTESRECPVSRADKTLNAHYRTCRASKRTTVRQPRVKHCGFFP